MVGRGEFVAVEGRRQREEHAASSVGGLDRDSAGPRACWLRCAGGHGCRAGRAPAHADRFVFPELQPASRADGARERAVARLLRRWSPGRGAAPARALDSRRPSDKAGARPAALSGGERTARRPSRRALLARPPLLLADRTHGQSRRQYRGGVIDLFRQLHREGMTLLICHPRGPGFPCRDPHPGAARRRPPRADGAEAMETE